MRTLSREFRPWLGLLLVLWLTLACALVIPESTPTPVPPTDTPVPSPTPKPVFDGQWTGTTSQGDPISFTIQNNGISEVNFKITVEGVGCSSTSETKVTFAEPRPIQNHEFSFTSTAGQSTSYSVIAQFSSESEASGSLQYEVGQGCNGSAMVDWTAARTGP